jgi:16S rRNA (guanine527-N7)-methyltransferase
LGAVAADSRGPALCAGLAALGLQASHDVAAKLLQYLDLLHKWNQAYNLSAVRDPQQMLPQHLLDCLAAVPALDRHLGQRAARILDVGSGAGLPGVVWALMRPQWSVVCVDTVAKKVSFVRQAIAELRLKNLIAEHARVEALRAGDFDVIACRAFASLADFTALTRAHLAVAGCWLAMKGKPPEDDIAALPPRVDVFHVEQLHVPSLDAQRCLVWMRPAASETGLTSQPT